MKQLKLWMIMILRYDNEVCYFFWRVKGISLFIQYYLKTVHHWQDGNPELTLNLCVGIES